MLAEIIEQKTGDGTLRWPPLPQRTDAAHLVMPSKLIGMLASGRAVAATEHPAYRDQVQLGAMTRIGARFNRGAMAVVTRATPAPD